MEILNQFLDDFRSVEFRDIPDDAFRKLSFHDQRALARYPVGRIIPVENWIGEIAVARPTRVLSPIYWIFHLAFGGSTFVSKYFGSFDNVISFREPFPLTQLSMRYRNEQNSPPEWLIAILLATMKWYCKVQEGSICLVKPHDAANYLIPFAMELSNESLGVLIYSNLETFVLKVLKDPLRREWIRSRISSCGAERSSAGRSRALLSLTDAEAAAWVWFGFSLHIAKASRYFNSKLKLISTESLRDSQNEQMSLIAQHLRLFVDRDELDQVDATISGMHSKSNRVFDLESEIREQSSQKKRFSGELALAKKLIDNLAKFPDVPQGFLQSYGMDCSEFAKMD